MTGRTAGHLPDDDPSPPFRRQTRPMTSDRPNPLQPHRAAQRLLAALVGVLLVLAAVVVGAVPAAAQNRVGASTLAVANTVGPSTGIGAGQRLGKTVPQPRFVVATGVAAEGGGMAGVRAAGQAGEDAAGIIKNTERIPSATGSAAYRIPDELGNGVLGEVKNVKSLSYSSQLQDFVAYAETNDLRFNLYVRESTTFSGPLQNLIDTGVINRVPSLGP